MLVVDAAAPQQAQPRATGAIWRSCFAVISALPSALALLLYGKCERGKSYGFPPRPTAARQIQEGVSYTTPEGFPIPVSCLEQHLRSGPRLEVLVWMTRQQSSTQVSTRPLPSCQ